MPAKRHRVGDEHAALAAPWRAASPSRCRPGRWCPSAMKLAASRSSASCAQIRFGCRGSTAATPLPRWVERARPGVHRGADLVRFGCRVAERDVDARGGKARRCRPGPRPVRRERHQPDSPPARALPLARTRPDRAGGRAPRVGAARPVLRREARPLDMQRADHMRPSAASAARASAMAGARRRGFLARR